MALTGSGEAKKACVPQMLACSGTILEKLKGMN